MHNYSIWLDNKDNFNYPVLNNDIECDILIIGGGISGISILYHLLENQKNVVLVERGKLGEGVSARTTGKLTYLQDNIYTKLNNEYSYEVAKLYYESQKEAINIVKEIINKNNIKCDFTKQTSNLYTKYRENIDKLIKEKELLIKMGCNIKENKLPINITNYYNISVSDTYYFHPVKYIKSLAKICFKKGTKIYEETSIIKIDKEDNKYICYTKNNKITSKKVIIASHYPFFLFPYLFPFKSHLEKSYISANIVNNSNNVSGINIDKDVVSFRYHNNYYINLLNNHNIAFKFNELSNFQDLSNNSNYIWSNIDIMTNDNLPYIGKLDNNLYLATGYNTWGMTNGSLSGVIISDLINNRPNKYINLFNPYRKMSIKSYLNIISNIFFSAKPFIQNKIIKNKEYYSKNVIFKKINGIDVGIYIDQNKKEHIVYNKCPHLKCSLIFNEVELLWECPCHASRFTMDGKCISGPSNKDITYKK